jgi:hypothetical protein
MARLAGKRHDLVEGHHDPCRAATAAQVGRCGRLMEILSEL